jgi:hypothetical protein
MAMRSGRFIGVLGWEEGLVPRGLMQLEKFVGNSTNLSTYDCPVVFRRIEGATTKTILEVPDPVVHDRMLEAAKELCAEGAVAITTSCGFNIILQGRLREAVGIPVFSSSLIQVPWVFSLLSPGASLLIVTAKKSALSEAHLAAAGIKNISQCHVAGLEENSEWNKIFKEPGEYVDVGKIKEEVLTTEEKTLLSRPETKAIVFECTDLPPFSDYVRIKTRLPVFDFVTMLRWIMSSLVIN